MLIPIGEDDGPSIRRSSGCREGEDVLEPFCMVLVLLEIIFMEAGLTRARIPAGMMGLVSRRMDPNTSDSRSSCKREEDARSFSIAEVGHVANDEGAVWPRPPRCPAGVGGTSQARDDKASSVGVTQSRESNTPDARLVMEAEAKMILGETP